MPLKSASSGSRAPQVSFPPQDHKNDEIQRFVNAEAKLKYELEVKTRPIHQEKGFLLQGAKRSGIPT